MELSFSPKRIRGVLFLGGVSLVLLAGEALLISLLQSSPIGTNFFLYALSAVIVAVPLLFLLYRLYSLLFSSYTLDRKGLHIQWGKRSEVIPLNMIEWIRRPEEMPYDIPWSVLPMPGAYLGTVPSEEYRQIEFLASDTSTMLFVGTPKAVYAVSPRRPDDFLEGFRRMLQYGSTEAETWTTYRPANWILESWRDQTGRTTVILTALQLLVMILYIGFRYTAGKRIPMQFSASGVAEEVHTGQTVLVIPVLACLSAAAAYFFGGQLYSRPGFQNTARLVWVFMTLTVLLFEIAVVLIF